MNHTHEFVRENGIVRHMTREEWFRREGFDGSRERTEAERTRGAWHCAILGLLVVAGLVATALFACTPIDTQGEVPVECVNY